MEMMLGVAKVLWFPIGSVIGTSDADDEDIIMPKTKLKPNAKLASPTKLQASFGGCGAEGHCNQADAEGRCEKLRLGSTSSCSCRVQQSRVKMGRALMVTSPASVGITGSAILSLLRTLLCALKMKAVWRPRRDGEGEDNDVGAGIGWDLDLWTLAVLLTRLVRAKREKAVGDGGAVEASTMGATAMLERRAMKRRAWPTTEASVVAACIARKECCCFVSIRKQRSRDR
ncbi:hypothetical protein B296_00018943 [Ensete ventricosum]|uniref:Uncharacterized protein n=1 Tax=Ensete ventricosum TaxID=4639 RepID=A0A427A9U5_ENSVE|nr:hypothetical protein B296_00018943 [Ensete ventricosum]